VIAKAAPTPCTARAAISQPALGASAQAADAATNTPSPARQDEPLLEALDVKRR
jgi:hypothetical protein